MKKQTLFTRRAVANLLMASFFTVGAATAATAQQASEKSPEPHVSYVGLMNQKYVFQVDYTASASDFTLEIKDKYGYQLYLDRFKAGKFSKRFAVDQAEVGDNGLTFTFVSAGKEQTQAFDINASFRVVEDVAVVKLK